MVTLPARTIKVHKEACIMESSLRPPLKWAGGKRWLVPYLQNIWMLHQGKRLVEPFVGGLAVSLGLQPESALLNDVNPHLINLYRNIQKGFRISIPLSNNKSLYTTLRNRFNALIATGKASTHEGATLFYYLNRTGFNGLCRFNSEGQFNVPFGTYSTINYIKDFSEYKTILSKWEFKNDDFEQLSLLPDDFVYADPPYDVPFTKYSKDGFTWEDQIRLAAWLSKHSGPVVISNQATKRIIDLYRRYGFKIRLLDAPRRISCNGDRTPAKEVLATRNI